MHTDKEPPDRGKEMLDWSNDVEMNYETNVASSSKKADEYTASGNVSHANNSNRPKTNSLSNTNEAQVSMESVPNNQLDNKNEDRYKELIKNKYRNSDPAPYFIFVEQNEKRLGRLFPIRVGHFLFSQKEFRDGIINIVPIGINRVKIVVSSYTVANKLVNHPILAKNNLRSYIPAYFTQKKGIIKLVDTMFDEKFLKENIQSGKQVLEVKRLFRKIKKEDGTVEYVKRQMILVTFLGSSIPNEIRINCCNFPVEPYIHPVITCFSCLRFGHISSQCKGKSRCSRCGENHNASECDADTLYCVHCGSNEHGSTNRKCPAFLKQYTIKKIMAAENITFKEAEFIAENPSYAKVSTNNRFSVLNNEENFPSLPNRDETKPFLSNKPMPKTGSTSTNNNKKRKASVSPSPPTPTSVSKAPKNISLSQPVTPNPYREEFLRYKESLFIQFTNHFDSLLKQIVPQNLYNHADIQNNISQFISTMKDNLDNHLAKNQSQ